MNLARRAGAYRSTVGRASHEDRVDVPDASGGRPRCARLAPDLLIKYTAKNPCDRFPDGRPKVPDELLTRLKALIAEEVQAVLPAKGFPNQFESRDGWRVLQPDQKMVGRVLTVQFMPTRGDIVEIDEADAKAKGTSRARNQTAIDMLQPGDVIVADVFGANWNFVGNKLAHYIQTTTKNGMIVDGGVYWLDRIAETGMQAYYKNSFPTQGMNVMVTGINIPVRLAENWKEEGGSRKSKVSVTERSRPSPSRSDILSRIRRRRPQGRVASSRHSQRHRQGHRLIPPCPTRFVRRFGSFAASQPLQRPSSSRWPWALERTRPCSPSSRPCSCDRCPTSAPASSWCCATATCGRG
jgi:regulator of RNase E activity RraA